MTFARLALVLLLVVVEQLGAPAGKQDDGGQTDDEESKQVCERVVAVVVSKHALVGDGARRVCAANGV